MSDLQAGRELDALVAEKVMDLPAEKWQPPCGRFHVTDYAEFDDGEWTGWCYTCGKSIGEVDDAPLPYSTDIAAAWEVVEKIFHKKGWSLWPLSDAKHIESDSPPWYATGWGVYTSSGIDLWDDEIAIGETAPLAICRAALKAAS